MHTCRRLIVSLLRNAQQHGTLECLQTLQGCVYNNASLSMSVSLSLFSKDGQDIYQNQHEIESVHLAKRTRQRYKLKVMEMNSISKGPINLIATVNWVYSASKKRDDVEEKLYINILNIHKSHGLNKNYLFTSNSDFSKMVLMFYHGFLTLAATTTSDRDIRPQTNTLKLQPHFKNIEVLCLQNNALRIETRWQRCFNWRN